jgi:hypothetical protein
MNNPQLVVLEGEIDKLTLSEKRELYQNPDLLGVWITAALTAVKGIGKGAKGIKKLVKKKKQAKRAIAAKKRKSAIPAAATIPGKKSVLPSRLIQARGPAEPGTSTGKFLPLAIAAGVLAIVFLNKK